MLKMKTVIQMHMAAKISRFGLNSRWAPIRTDTTFAHVNTLRGELPRHLLFPTAALHQAALH